MAGCSAPAESEQESAVIPADARVASERADRSRVKGADDAPVRVVEVSDFQCPYCARFHHQTLGKIDSAYISSGKLNYVWVSYANPSHSQAFVSSEAAFCAGAVGKFWPMHDMLFERQEEWSGAEDAYSLFVGYAADIGVDPESFGLCVRNSTLATLVVTDFANASNAGIASTPYFILADSVVIQGAADFETFSQAIDTLLVLAGEGEVAEQAPELER